MDPMTENSPLEQTLCSKFCTYYKPGKNEDLACKGYEVVEQLLREGKIPVIANNNSESSPELADSIVKILCIACDFHEQDCDFMQNRAARPCGGFVLLAQLLESGVLSLEDIR
jgi:hypothetical protein